MTLYGFFTLYVCCTCWSAPHLNPPFSTILVVRPIPTDYYTYYYTNACPECVHVLTIIIPITVHIQYLPWVSLESLQYGGLLLQNISLTKTKVIKAVSGGGPGETCSQYVAA